jgi:hypothetical protein
MFVLILFKEILMFHKKKRKEKKRKEKKRKEKKRKEKKRKEKKRKEKKERKKEDIEMLIFSKNYQEAKK